MYGDSGAGTLPTDSGSDTDTTTTWDSGTTRTDTTTYGDSGGSFGDSGF